MKSYDEKLMKGMRIAPCDIPLTHPTQQLDVDGMLTDISALRQSVTNWINRARDEHYRGDKWMTFALCGWLIVFLFVFDKVSQ